MSRVTLSLVTAGHYDTIRYDMIQYNTIQILLLTSHGGFSENTKIFSINSYLKKLFTYTLVVLVRYTSIAVVVSRIHLQSRVKKSY